MGNTISTGSGILNAKEKGILTQDMVQTLAHEKTHVLQSGVFSPTFFPLYYSMKGIGYIRHFLSNGNFYRPFGFPDVNLFEIWAYRNAEYVSGLKYNTIIFDGLWWR